MANHLKPLASYKKNLTRIFDTVEFDLRNSDILNHQGIDRIIAARTYAYTELEIARHLGVSIGSIKKWLREDKERLTAWDDTTEALGEHLMMDVINDVSEDIILDVKWDKKKKDKSQFNLDKQTKQAHILLKRTDQKIKAKQELAKSLLSKGDKTVGEGVVINVIGVKIDE